jgi:hypothetical protein
LTPGTNWVSAIYESIESADAVIILLSKASTGSENLRIELSASIASQSAHPNKRIIPVVLERDIEKPFYLSQYQYIDMSDDWKSALNQLVAALKGSPPGPQTPADPRRARR